ncbi:MAG: hypothetical protein NZ853_07185 [Leptospiraceae bacterium]|nr:hypothetical protein [Leptospiraceae bacterium]MDW7975783.1 hypothetical protein [Leptospiraceae bacterium]
MDTFILLLILIFSFLSCKKDQELKIQEQSKKDITGIYEVYPSYERILIKFEPEYQCKILIKDELHTCSYHVVNDQLHIFQSEKNEILGVFLLSKENLLRGVWKKEVRFLRKLE